MSVNASITLNLEKLPEIIFLLRVEMANMLRDEADALADLRVAALLRKLATEFEVGGTA